MSLASFRHRVLMLFISVPFIRILMAVAVWSIISPEFMKESASLLAFVLLNDRLVKRSVQTTQEGLLLQIAPKLPFALGLGLAFLAPVYTLLNGLKLACERATWKPKADKYLDLYCLFLFAAMATLGAQVYIADPPASPLMRYSFAALTVFFEIMGLVTFRKMYAVLIEEGPEPEEDEDESRYGSDQSSEDEYDSDDESGSDWDNQNFLPEEDQFDLAEDDRESHDSALEEDTDDDEEEEEEEEEEVDEDGNEPQPYVVDDDWGVNDAHP